MAAKRAIASLETQLRESRGTPCAGAAVRRKRPLALEAIAFFFTQRAHATICRLWADCCSENKEGTFSYCLALE